MQIATKEPEIAARQHVVGEQDVIQECRRSADCTKGAHGSNERGPRGQLRNWYRSAAGVQIATKQPKVTTTEPEMAT